MKSKMYTFMSVVPQCPVLLKWYGTFELYIPFMVWTVHVFSHSLFHCIVCCILHLCSRLNLNCCMLCYVSLCGCDLCFHCVT